ncbi:hypothetical protein [Kaistella flava (ex Peng et al. 2021)]|uniref:hypothetical protein n=1 Tax=Kaistella flava (ex Peng et al. 2021) TaxID=2038776 RepID=UPI00187F232C|nr:hypothetical protein [Kaistella flava (ex Peng et al. 2021)]
MATNDKNTPGPIVVIAIAVIALMIIFYFILLMYFPNLFESLDIGKVKAVK